MLTIEVRNLVKHYGSVKAVNGVSFSVAEGTCFGLLGPNGAGKTTTIEVLEGILKAGSGEILYKGNRIDRRFKEEAGIQFQMTALQDYLTVMEVLQLFRQLYKEGMEIDELIDLCALNEFVHRDNRTLSGGQKQRLLLAIALVNDPKILFLDEPTTGMDPQSRRNFWDLIKQIKSSNKTIILTTHYMEEAAILCDTVAIMDQGQIIANGIPEELLKQHFNDILLIIPEEHYQLDVDTQPFKLSRSAGKVTIHSENVHETLRFLNDHCVNLSRLNIRTRNLEDLFLELTGKSLRA